MRGDGQFQLQDVLRRDSRGLGSRRARRAAGGVATGETLHVAACGLQRRREIQLRDGRPGETARTTARGLRREAAAAERPAALQTASVPRSWYSIADGRPYLPRRAPRQSVFPGGYHCTASGETVWNEAGDFDGLFTANICRELEEEVGLTGQDLDRLRPVAFCREFLRAGKPQFFFAAGTSGRAGLPGGASRQSSSRSPVAIRKFSMRC